MLKSICISCTNRLKSLELTVKHARKRERVGLIRGQEQGDPVLHSLSSTFFTYDFPLLQRHWNLFIYSSWKVVRCLLVKRFRTLLEHFFKKWNTIFRGHEASSTTSFMFCIAALLFVDIPPRSWDTLIISSSAVQIIHNDTF